MYKKGNATPNSTKSIQPKYGIVLGKVHLLCGGGVGGGGGGGGEDVKGGTEIFSGIKGGPLKVLDILKGGGGSKLFKVLVQQGPGVFTPTIVNRIDGLQTPPTVKFRQKSCKIQVKILTFLGKICVIK